jgi:hypothetical protein
MLLGSILFLLGLAELLFPKRVVDFWMRLASAEDEDVKLRRWVYTVARIEGFVILVWLWRRGRKVVE